MTVWTQEMRDKAAATRLANKQKKEERERKRNEKLAQTPQPILSNAVAQIPEPKAVSEAVPFDWETCPLVEAINKQAEMRREYERISAIVLRRQNPYGTRWTCWTEERRLANEAGKIPKSVLAQCARTGEDGKWKFRDDGRSVLVGGAKVLKPAFCCNSGCFALYQQSRQSPQR